MNQRNDGSSKSLVWQCMTMGIACLIAILIQTSGLFGIAEVGAKVEPPAVALELAQLQFPFDVMATPAPGGSTQVVGLADSSQAGTSIDEISRKRIGGGFVRILKWYVLQIDERDIYTIKLASVEGKNMDLWIFIPIQSPSFPQGLKLIDYSASLFPVETIGPRVFETGIVRSEVTGNAYDQRRLFIGVSLVGSSTAFFGSPFSLNVTRRTASGEMLIDDDWTGEHGIVENNFAVVNRLTPYRYPAKLETIQFISEQVEGAANPVGSDVRVIAFADPLGFGKPPQRPMLLFDRSVKIQRFGVNEVKVDNPPVIMSGDFYIGYQIPQDAFGVAVNFDTDGPPRRKSFFSTDNLSLFSGPMTVVDLQGKRFDANALFRGIISYP